jgi:LDH2 family malate/lactate/ureidoglycolate dehydrogenase
MTATTTIDADSLSDLSTAILEAAGARPEDAQATTKILIEGEMMGIDTHGVIRLQSYTERLRSGGITARPAMTVDQRADSLAIVDGDNALGPAVGMRGLETALQLARKAGIAYVGCRGSNHVGALAPYALQACEAGFVSVMGTNASTTMPPWGGAEARIGNNPIAIAAPCPDAPHFILDMAMSVAARGKIRAAQSEGRPIPEGWAVDAAGRPTTDPAEALAGFLVPFGGHKGSGLSQAVDMLSGVISGARFLTGISSWVDDPQAPQGVGHFFLLIDPARLIGRARYDEAMAAFRDTVIGTLPADPGVPVQMPGQREQAHRARALTDGIELPEALLKSLRRLAA